MTPSCYLIFVSGAIIFTWSYLMRRNFSTEKYYYIMIHAVFYPLLNQLYQTLYLKNSCINMIFLSCHTYLVRDRHPPARIVDLISVFNRDNMLLNLQWSAPGDDLNVGRGTMVKQEI